MDLKTTPCLLISQRQKADSKHKWHSQCISWSPFWCSTRFNSRTNTVQHIFKWSIYSDQHNNDNDNTLSESADTENELIQKLEAEACKTIDWLSSNSMIANSGKFHGIILKKNRSDTTRRIVKIKGKKIETDTDVALLGVAIDNKLSFKKHITDLCKKASAKLNAIKRLSPRPCVKARKL